MIVQWRIASTANVFEATWQDYHFRLEYVPVERRWRLLVDGQGSRNRWLTSRAAQEAVDAHIQSIIARTEGVKAQQRPLSGERIVKHAG